MSVFDPAIFDPVVFDITDGDVEFTGPAVLYGRSFTNMVTPAGEAATATAAGNWNKAELIDHV